MKKFGIVLAAGIMLAGTTSAYSFYGNFGCHYESKTSVSKDMIRYEPLFGSYLIGQLFSRIGVCGYRDYE